MIFSKKHDSTDDLDAVDKRFRQQASWTIAFQQRVLSLLPNRKINILEVGCGTGSFLCSLQSIRNSADIHWVGLDIAYDRLAYAQQRIIADWVNGDGMVLPFPAEAFDLVICHYLLLWLKRPCQVLTEMKRVARLGGWIVATAEPDYLSRIDYPDRFVDAGKAQTEALRAMGANPQAGRELPNLFHSAGMEDPLFGIHGTEYQGDEYQNFLEEESRQLKNDIGNGKTIETTIGRVFYVPTFYAIYQKWSK